MLWIGNYAAAHSTGITEADYFVTGWKTSWIGISFSIAATFASGAFVLGTIGVFYGNPSALTGYAFGTTFAPFLLWILGRRIWAIGRKYGYSTFTDLIGDYYQSEKLRVVVSILICIFFAPYLAVNFIAPAILITQVTGGGPAVFWLSCLVFGVITTIYTWRGGMRAVIWTDIAQTIIMIIGFAIIIPILFGIGGGWSAVWEELQKKSLPINPMAGASGSCSPGSESLGSCNREPRQGVPFIGASDPRSIRKGCIASIVLLTIWSLVGFFLG